jgi:hypothetical protein
MRDAKTVIEETQQELARTEEVLAQLAQALDAFAEVGGELTPEMHETIELMAKELPAAAPATMLPTYAIQV